MTDAPAFDTIEDASEEELASILRYLSERTEGDRPPLLVGGWAVYAYNPYSKSQDIDLVLSSRHRGSLLSWLQHEHGYERKRAHRDGWHGAVKSATTRAGSQEIVVDVGTFDEEYPLEGREEQLNFDLCLTENVVRRVAGINVRVPTRSLLLLYKAKAAWDRGTRLTQDRYDRDADRRYDRNKLVKDRADLLALTDPRVGADWNLRFLREQLDRIPVLVDVLREAPTFGASRARYRSVSEEDAARGVDRLLSLVGLRG